MSRPAPERDGAASPPVSRRREVAYLFAKLGVIGFGGPAAHIALMRDEVVRRRGWVDDREFLELVGVTNLIPGPNSTELAIHLGHRRAGRWGLVLAGLCFITPAVLIVGVLAWLYANNGSRPLIIDLRYGVLPVIIAIVAHAVYSLGRSVCTTAVPVVLAGAAFAGFLAGLPELPVLLGAGLLCLAWRRRGSLHPRNALGMALWPFAVSGTVPRDGVPRDPVSLHRLFLVFLEIGSVLYGSGYVLLAFLQSNLVDDRGWLTEQQLLDAVAVGQVTPGPVFSTATFVGWQIHGFSGAVAATVGIFFPSFVLVAMLGWLVGWIRRHAWARAFLEGVTAASLGLMAGVLVQLADAAISDVVTASVAMVALCMLVRTKINSAWLVGAGLLIGAAHALAV